MRHPKGFIVAMPLLAVLVIVALAAAGGSWWYVQNKKQEAANVNAGVAVNTNTTANTNVATNSNANTAPDPTAGWKTYTNTNQGYAIQYPSDWSVTTSSAGSVGLLPPDYDAKTSIELGPRIGITNVDKIAAVASANATSKVIADHDCNQNRRTLIVNGMSSTQQDESCFATIVTTYIPKGVKYIKVSWPEVFEKDYPQYNTILSTLTFLDETEKISTFWFMHSPAPSYKPYLKSVDTSNGKVTTWTSYPSQGPNSDNFIPAPSSKQFAYVKFEKSTHGLYIASTNGTNEKLLASGFICLDGPCDLGTSVQLGSFSMDGGYISFRKGAKTVVHNLKTNQETELPVSSTRPASFSSKDTYVYTPIGDSQSGQPTGIAYGKLSDTTFKTLDFPAGGSISFSPMENFVAYSQQDFDFATQKTTTRIGVTSLANGSIVDSLVVNQPQTGVHNVTWLSNSSFAVLLNENSSEEQRGVYVYTLKNNKLSSKRAYIGKNLNELRTIDENTILTSSYGDANTVILLNVGSGVAKNILTLPKSDWFGILGTKR